MIARVLSFALDGIDGYPVIVEIDIGGGLPGFDTVGLPDAAVKESKDRVKSAIKNSGLNFPQMKIVANLAPADTKKEGSLYDLPIALAILAATGQILFEKLNDTVFVGELSLYGEIRKVNGVLPIVISAVKQGYKKIIVPYDNASEACFIDGIDIYAVKTLAEVFLHYTGKVEMEQCTKRKWEDIVKHKPTGNDFSDIKGQFAAKRAMEIASSGGHNVLLVGPPGSGKTMLARALPSILPELSFDEALEITKIHSIAGILDNGIVMERPFRSPHHTASTVSLTGGGRKALPGEISLANHGILFLDEFPEYQRSTLEAMRQPLEDGFITVTRVQNTVRYPAHFMLVASMNPCPCGKYGDPNQVCKCTPPQIQRYLRKISGPLLDRIDIQIEVEAVPYEDIAGRKETETSEQIRKRVQTARSIQLERYKNDDVYCNAQLNSAHLHKFCSLPPEGEALMSKVFKKFNMSARAYTRILKVARTIADLDGKEQISADNLMEAIQYRSIDRKYWG